MFLVVLMVTLSPSSDWISPAMKASFSSLTQQERLMSYGLFIASRRSFSVGTRNGMGSTSSPHSPLYGMAAAAAATDTHRPSDWPAHLLLAAAETGWEKAEIKVLIVVRGMTLISIISNHQCLTQAHTHQRRMQRSAQEDYGCMCWGQAVIYQAFPPRYGHNSKTSHHPEVSSLWSACSDHWQHGIWEFFSLPPSI